MKRVLAFGTFDKFHPGHRYVLHHAKQHGDHLVVVVARDENVRVIKGNLPFQPEQQRLAQVQKFIHVDEAQLGLEDYTQRMSVIDQVQPNVIVLGYDQAPGFKSPSADIEIIRLDSYHPEKYKSSLL